jgi:hypothetical protein
VITEPLTIRRRTHTGVDRHGQARSTVVEVAARGRIWPYRKTAGGPSGTVGTVLAEAVVMADELTLADELLDASGERWEVVELMWRGGLGVSHWACALRRITGTV